MFTASASPTVTSRTNERAPLSTTALLLSVALGLFGCAAPGAAPEADPLNTSLNASAWAQASSLPVPPAHTGWRHQGMGNRPVSVYLPVQHQGRPALQGRSERGDSLVRLPLAVTGPELGQLRFSWYVDALNPLSDLADRHLDDAVARVIVQFDGDRSSFSARDHMLSDLIQMATGEPLPFATLMYVWDARYPVGTVIPHARSARIKTLVIESGSQRLGQWVNFERDVAADYRAAFGQAPQSVNGIALMTDSNNTQHASAAWYGPLSWTRAPY